MIGFESDEAYLRKLRERLQAMSDAELNKFGKASVPSHITIDKMSGYVLMAACLPPPQLFPWMTTPRSSWNRWSALEQRHNG